MKDYLKFLNRLPKPLKNKLLKVIEKIANDKLRGLDVVGLVAWDEMYRCRVGKIRIIFKKIGDENIILNIGFRGDIYKGKN